MSLTRKASKFSFLLWVFILVIGGLSLTARVSAQSPTTFSLYFGDIVHGGTGSLFQTTLQVFNSSNQDVNATINIYQDNGTAFNVGLKDGSTGNPLTPTSPGVFGVLIPARGLKVLITTGNQPLQAGWLQVTSSSNRLNGNVFFQQIDSSGTLLMQAAVPNSVPLSAFTGVFEKSATVGTGVALANPSPTATASATLQIIGANGVPGPSQNISIGPLQHIAQFVDQFPQFASVANGVGTIAVSSSTNLVATFLRLDRNQLTTLPLFSGTSLVPSLTSISPNSGAQDTTVTISGVNFDSNNPANNVVTFNNVTASIINLSSTAIVTTVPAGLPFTMINVTVSANGGTSNALSFTVNPGSPVPVITSLDPPTVLVGSAATNVTINGKNFSPPQAGAFVRFGSAKPSVQLVNSTKAIMTLTPDLLGQIGTFNVTYVNPSNALFGENSSNVVQFGVTNQVSTQPPTITSISPTSAQTNQRVTITGTNFDPVNINNNVVKFNGVAASQIVSATGTQIVVNVPVGATSGPVTVTTNGLVSNSINFTVVPIPALRTVQVDLTPTRVAYDPVLNQAVITNSGGNSVSFVDVGNAVLTKTVAVGGSNPIGIGIFGRLAVVANFNQLTSTQRMVSLINLDTQSFDSSITVTALGGSPFNVGIDSAGGNAVITDNSGHIGLLNLVTKQITPYFVSTPYDVAVYNPSQNVDWALITDFSENKLIIFDLQQQVQRTVVVVGQTPQGVAVNPTTGIAAVVNSGDNTVSLVNLNNPAGPSVVATIPVGLRPNYVAIDSSRNRAVVSNNGAGTVSVIDLAAKAVIATLSTGGNNPAGVAVSQSGGVAIVANQNSGTVGIILIP